MKYVPFFLDVDGDIGYLTIPYTEFAKLKLISQKRKITLSELFDERIKNFGFSASLPRQIMEEYANS